MIWQIAGVMKMDREQNSHLQEVQERSREFTTWPAVCGMVAKGIDVSQWNGTIDWQKVKNAGVDYAIIRCGFGMNQTNQDDTKWKENADACTKYNIPFGVIFILMQRILHVRRAKQNMYYVR